MTTRRRTTLPVLAAAALLLMGAGPSAGDRLADAQRPAPAADPLRPADPGTPVPCQDDRAVLVATGGAGGVLFRCSGGVPVPRTGPWSTDGCAWDYRPEVVYAGSGATWQPATACYIVSSPSGFIPVDGVARLGR